MIVVYTALFGDQARDQVRRPPASVDTRYVCFTDAAGRGVSGWEVETVAAPDRCPRLLARLYKVRPDRWFGRQATTIWLDASVELLVPPADLVRATTVAPVAGFRHPDRASLEDEAGVVTSLRAAPAAVVAQQLVDYRRRGFETHEAVVTTTGLLVRTPAAHACNLLWEEQILRYHLRDQLSLDYCAWATHTPVAHLPGSYRRNEFMRYHPHARLAAC